jgi:SAM-dependent methyltransferase
MYRLMYLLGQTHWDTGITPPEVEQAFQSGDIPPGPALDLGCGTGTNVIYMAQHGRQVTGLDFTPSAIKKARRKAKDAGVDNLTKFLVADATRLGDMNLPPCAFALDMGCFHGFSPDGRQQYIDGLAKTLIPGGWYMLFTLDPHSEAGYSFGILPEDVQALFLPRFEITRLERGVYTTHNTTWFWLKRRSDT